MDDRTHFDSKVTDLLSWIEQKRNKNHCAQCWHKGQVKNSGRRRGAELTAHDWVQLEDLQLPALSNQSISSHTQEQQEWPEHTQTHTE